MKLVIDRSLLIFAVLSLKRKRNVSSEVSLAFKLRRSWGTDWLIQDKVILIYLSFKLNFAPKVPTGNQEEDDPPPTILKLKKTGASNWQLQDQVNPAIFFFTLS